MAPWVLCSTETTNKHSETLLVKQQIKAGNQIHLKGHRKQKKHKSQLMYCFWNSVVCCDLRERHLVNFGNK